MFFGGTGMKYDAIVIGGGLSGLSAANALLKKLGKEPNVYRKDMKNFVRIVKKPFTTDRLYDGYSNTVRTVLNKVMRCRLCEHPACSKDVDVRGIMRRAAVGKCWLKNPVDAAMLEKYEKDCICTAEGKASVEIRDVIDFLNRENVICGDQNV
jgi:prolycopene isomerase